MKCPKCGEELLEGFNFCNNCGAKINWDELKTEVETSVEEALGTDPVDTGLEKEEIEKVSFSDTGKVTQKKCVVCKRPISENARFCRHCGADQREGADNTELKKKYVRKKTFKITAIVLGVLAVGCFLFMTIVNPVSIDKVVHASVDPKSLNGGGRVSWEIDYELLAKKVGNSKLNDIKNSIRYYWPDPEYIDWSYWSDYNYLAEMLTVSVDGNGSLSNGDTAVVRCVPGEGAAMMGISSFSEVCDKLGITMKESLGIEVAGLREGVPIDLALESPEQYIYFTQWNSIGAGEVTGQFPETYSSGNYTLHMDFYGEDGWTPFYPYVFESDEYIPDKRYIPYSVYEGDEYIGELDYQVILPEGHTANGGSPEGSPVKLVVVADGYLAEKLAEDGLIAERKETVINIPSNSVILSKYSDEEMKKLSGTVRRQAKAYGNLMFISMFRAKPADGADGEDMALYLATDYYGQSYFIRIDKTCFTVKADGDAKLDRIVTEVVPEWISEQQLLEDPVRYAGSVFSGYELVKLGSINEDGSAEYGTVMVLASQLRIRKQPSKNGEFVQYAEQGKTYRVYGIVDADGYTWYQIGDGMYLASKEGKWTQRITE